MNYTQSGAERILVVRGGHPEGSVIFIPLGADGKPDAMAQSIIRLLGVHQHNLPSPGTLTSGYSFQIFHGVTLAYIVIDGAGEAVVNLFSHLSTAFSALGLKPSTTMWIPLMGNGADRLPALRSFSTILDALQTSGAVSKYGAAVTISVPENLSAAEFDAIMALFNNRVGAPGAASDAGEAPATRLRFPANADLMYSDSLWALIRVVRALADFKADHSRFLSTSTLFFGLALPAYRDEVGAFVNSPSAARFAASMKVLVGAKFAQAWSNYFERDLDSFLLRQHLRQDALPFTENCIDWLTAAGRIAQRKGQAEVTVGDLIDAMAEQPAGRFNAILDGLGISIARLLAEYDNRNVQQGGAARPGKPFEFLVHDRATHVDSMDFAQYAIAITSFLTSAETSGPISISIQAPWGAGKSSLMQQVRQRLDPENVRVPAARDLSVRQVWQFLKGPKTPVAPAAAAAAAAPRTRWTVWFNAWKYESSDQIWAGLVDAIVSQVSDRLDPVERELFLLRLNLARIDDGKVRERLHDRLVNLWWSGARWLLMAAALVPSALLALGIDDVKKIAGTTLGTTATLALAWLAKSWAALEKEPATFSLAEYLNVPDYGKTMGMMHHIHQDLQRVVDLLPRAENGDGARAAARPLVIFIDDLDRCSPNKVASIVEGINTFLASDQKEFMFVIGMDPQMVAAALEHAHKDVKNYLPPYERGAPLGWRFMDKFIQLAFTIPPRRAGAIEGFVRSLTRAVAAFPAAVPPAQTAQNGQHGVRLPGPGPVQQQAPLTSLSAAEAEAVQQSVSQALTNESEDVQQMLSGITTQFVFSPREIKRILNQIRFVLLLRIGRIAAGDAVPSLQLYQRWIVLCMRWPDLARWLQWGMEVSVSAAASSLLTGVTAHRLEILEGATAPAGTSLSDWATSAARDIGMPAGGALWLTDPDLYRFFSAEQTREPAERLSRGASLGFY